MTEIVALQNTAPRGIVVSLDERAGMLTITVPKRITMPELFVRACHNLAGETGCGIKWARP